MCVYILTDNVFITHSVTTLCVCVYICDEMKKNPCMHDLQREKEEAKNNEKKRSAFFFLKAQNAEKRHTPHTPHTDKKREKKETQIIRD